MNVVPLAWTKLARDDERRKEKKKKNDDPRGRRRRLFENEARLACSPFVFWGGYSARARALQHEDFWGNFFVWSKLKKHFEKYNEEYYYYYYDYAED
jgi:hypothetical protein